MRKDSSIIIGNKVVIGDGVKISALNGGNIYIGDNVGIGDYDQIVCHESINVDNGCNLAPQVYMFDHDHVMKSEGVVRNQFITKSISIGQNTWIGVNTTILKGSQIGKNCVVAAGSIVRGKVDNGTKYIQKRSTTMEAIPF